MEYDQEGLLPIVAKLIDRYTSKESSSVTYDTANMLMEAVLYCINENYSDKDKNLLTADKSIDYMTIYNQGVQIIIDKVKKAKEIYDRIIENFDDFECVNYHATILKGIPNFFVWYNASFCPQDHLLTLDYPTMFMNNEKTGIDQILEYLTCIEKEKSFLQLFGHQAVVELLEKVQLDYRDIYLDNICSIVLLQAIGCAIVDRPILELKLEDEDCETIAFYFEGDSIDTIRYKIAKIIELITNKAADQELSKYFMEICQDYAFRINEGMKHDFLPNIFITS